MFLLKIDIYIYIYTSISMYLRGKLKPLLVFAYPPLPSNLHVSCKIKDVPGFREKGPKFFDCDAAFSQKFLYRMSKICILF